MLNNQLLCFKALVYYTFGALGGNLIAHMILVSKIVNNFIDSRTFLYSDIVNVRFAVM